MIAAQIAGREFPLALTLDAMAELEQLSGEAFDGQGVVERIRDWHTLPGIVAVMAKHGGILAGETVTEDETWFRQHIRMGELLNVQRATLEAISDGMRMETEQAAPGESVDVVLEDLKKKEATGG